MKVFWILLRANGRKTIVVMLLGTLSGLASTALIAVASKTVSSTSGGNRARAILALAFLVAVLVKVGASLASDLIMGRSMQEVVLQMCRNLCWKVAATPLRKLEEIGGPRVMTCLTDDIAVLSEAIQKIPSLVVDGMMLAGCTIYLAWVSPVPAMMLVVLVVIMTLVYRFLMHRAGQAVIKARNSRDTLFGHFRSLVEGIKEIKLHDGRRDAFFIEDVNRTTNYLREQNVVAMNRYAVADGWCQSMFYVLLGAVLFVMPLVRPADSKALTAYVLVALYMMGPVLSLIGSTHLFIRGNVSIEKLEQLGLLLTDITAKSSEQPSRTEAEETVATTPVHRTPPLVAFRNVVFQHGNAESENRFTLGPIDLTLNPGELVFIIGGNGSGKSTLAKVLTGLYTPDSGEIRVDGTLIGPDSENAYRQLYSAVFSDFFLFDRLLGIDPSEQRSRRVQEFLTSLGLSDVVKMNGDSFSTISLSQGQRRRLALVVAYLEDRPIYVLDEWAADQDPEFRKIFYLELLPELKARGKTVVLITHDDRYFHLGDRVIKLDYGKVIETTKQNALTGILQ
jgi:putative ATP-binding cassette transporter